MTKPHSPVLAVLNAITGYKSECTCCKNWACLRSTSKLNSSKNILLFPLNLYHQVCVILKTKNFIEFIQKGKSQLQHRDNSAQTSNNCKNKHADKKTCKVTAYKRLCLSSAVREYKSSHVLSLCHPWIHTYCNTIRRYMVSQGCVCVFTSSRLTFMPNGSR